VALCPLTGLLVLGFGYIGISNLSVSRGA